LIRDERSYNPSFGVQFSWAAEVEMPDAFVRGVFVLTTLVVIAFAPLAQAQADAAPSVLAQPAPPDTPERSHALETYHAGRFVEAMPLLENLAAEYPSDVQIREAWAVSVFGYSATISDPETRRKARVRARSLAVQAQKMGDNALLLQVMLEIPEDGSEVAFSNRKDVDDAMKSAEADFARGDMDKAREGYLRASLLDPNSYEAALFIGDTYFKQHASVSAGEWFARTTQIDPNRETAYRYWGDALWDLGKSADAREKYIGAVIAEPYNQNSWSGLSQWAQKTKVQLNWVRLQDKAKIVSTANGPRVTLDPSLHSEDPMFKPWLAYAGRRIQWQKEKFKREFPNDAKYRHTLLEEVDALRLMVLALSQPDVAGKLDPSLAALVKIDQAGFLEPFALLNHADADVAQDYTSYRTAHRNTLYRYFDEFVVPKTPVIAEVSNR
jgi:tetratricopeptide (TPR) repeat protein